VTSTAIRRPATARLSTRRGAVFVEEAGWELPASYGDDAAERAVIRDRVALADVTARAKVDVRGRVPGTLPLPEDALPARISPSWTVVFGPPDAEASMIDAIGAETGSDVSVTDVTHGYAGFALLGPDVPRVFERATAWDPSTLAPGGAAAAPVVEVPALIVRRDLSVPAFEVFLDVGYARYAWEELSRVVGALGGQPVGWQALRAEGWR
jgi:glycine cleavage system aminomethyltransferase T